MIKILYVAGGTLQFGGTESVMMNYFRYVNSENIHIDFLVHGTKKGVYDDEIIKKGSKIYYVKNKTEGVISNYLTIKRIMKNGQYDIVHSHMDAMNYYILWIAKQAGVKVRVSHCHNTQTQYPNNSIIHKIANDGLKKIVNLVSTDRFACSLEAGQWLYGKKNFKIIHNAFACDDFIYSEIFRKEIRQQYNINNDTFLLGTVGRISRQKNHFFLIDLMNILVNTYNFNICLMIVGDGEQKPDIMNLIKKFNLDNRVIIVSPNSDIYKFYQAFDLFVFPSLFEGLGIVLIEAQISGVKCIASSNIPKNVKITDLLYFLDIEPHDESILSWVKLIKEIYQTINKEKRESQLSSAIKSGYDIKKESHNLIEFYESKVSKCR